MKNPKKIQKIISLIFKVYKNTSIFLFTIILIDY